MTSSTSQVAEGVEPPPWTSLAGQGVDLGVVVTHHDWRIEYVSPCPEGGQGHDPHSLVGRALLGFVYPDDAAKLLRAIEGDVTSKRATIARLRLRAVDGSCQGRTCFVTTLCDHDRPRLAVLLSGPALAPATTESAGVEELEERLWRIALEVRAAGLIRDAGSALQAHQSAELAGRQWEIVTRLVNGQSVPEIARAMYLSQSTVRNHLTAVYRKFGVHPQRELVALLTSAARPPI